MKQQEEWLQETCIEFLERTDWFIVIAREYSKFKVQIEFYLFDEDCDDKLKAMFVVEKEVVQNWAWKRWRWKEHIPPTILKFM